MLSKFPKQCDMDTYVVVDNIVINVKLDFARLTDARKMHMVF